MPLIRPDENVFMQAPYLHDSNSSKRIMLDIFLMLILICISAVVLFGIKAFFLLTVAIVTAFFCAYFVKLYDRSFFMTSFAWINGILVLMLMLPVSVSWFIPVLGVLLYFFNYLIFKIKNYQIFHPVLLAKLILYLLFPPISDKPPTLFQIMNQYSVNWFQANVILFNQDLTSEIYSDPPLWEIFWGNTPGNMGETSLVLLLFSLFYLGIRNIFSLVIPLVYLGTIFLLTLCVGFLNKNLLSLDMVRFLFQNSILFVSVFVLPYFATQPIRIAWKIWVSFLSAASVFVLQMQGVWLAQIITLLLIGAITSILDIWPNYPYFGSQKKVSRERYYFSLRLFLDQIKNHSLYFITACCIMIMIYLLNTILVII